MTIVYKNILVKDQCLILQYSADKTTFNNFWWVENLGLDEVRCRHMLLRWGLGKGVAVCYHAMWVVV